MLGPFAVWFHILHVYTQNQLAYLPLAYTWYLPVKSVFVSMHLYPEFGGAIKSHIHSQAATVFTFTDLPLSMYMCNNLWFGWVKKIFTCSVFSALTFSTRMFSILWSTFQVKEVKLSLKYCQIWYILNRKSVLRLINSIINIKKTLNTCLNSQLCLVE